jgi:hypothetical protein
MFPTWTRTVFKVMPRWTAISAIDLPSARIVDVAIVEGQDAMVRVLFNDPSIHEKHSAISGSDAAACGVLDRRARRGGACARQIDIGGRGEFSGCRLLQPSRRICCAQALRAEPNDAAQDQ